MTSKSNVLIFSNTYENAGNVTKLAVSKNDGEVLERVFKSNSNFDLVEWKPNVTTAEAMRRDVKNFVGKCNQATDLDTVYFIFSGHGGHGSATPPGYKEKEDNYVLTDGGVERNNIMLKKEIQKHFCKIKAKHKVLVYNCCRNRAIAGTLRDIEQDITNEDHANTWILHATTPEHVSWTNRHGAHHTSVFVCFFLEALETIANSEHVHFESIPRLINKKYRSYEPSPGDWYKEKDGQRVIVPRAEVRGDVRNQLCTMVSIPTDGDPQLPYPATPRSQ